MVASRLLLDVSPECRQCLFVTAKAESSTEASLRLLERSDADACWQQTDADIPVSLGRNGLAWGQGEHDVPLSQMARLKREGDGCAPAGIFRLPSAFGDAGAAPVGCKLSYLPISDSLLAVDDPQSVHYNQIVDSGHVPQDWSSTEFMRRADGLYRWGIVVGHNPANQPGLGSCIFIHLWRGAGQPTAGCTAMSEANLLRLLLWLDPAKEPRLVQGLAG